MKCVPVPAASTPRVSLPVRGAWIEMIAKGIACDSQLSLPVRGAWIEIDRADNYTHNRASLPVRGAWIEIGQRLQKRMDASVAPRAGSVD